jgi:xylulokinase
MTRTQVLLDRNGRALGPALLFRDRRAGFEASARLAWIERHQPARFARIAHVLEPREYLAYRLSGVIANDAAHAPWRQVGSVRALRGSPACRCSRRDGHVGVRGRRRRGRARAGLRRRRHDRSGRPRDRTTGRCATGCARCRGPRRRIKSAGRRRRVPTARAGATTRFACAGSLADAIARIGPALREDAPVFLPYLAGERAPVWSSGVRGAFHRVDRAHAPDDFLWSVMEGVAHAVRDIVRSRKRPPAWRRTSCAHAAAARSPTPGAR